MYKYFCSALLLLLLSCSSYTYVPPADTKPTVAENGDIKNADNDGDGRKEPVYVKGYYKADGTYVQGHYRAAPAKTEKADKK